ncbi:hypothetical protein F5H01DRAFT_344453 [Linnemannia elongata]|nr:hypothetical protein F5H01DRAFT_344453 [Linnemannia elongata]
MMVFASRGVLLRAMLAVALVQLLESCPVMPHPTQKAGAFLQKKYVFHRRKLAILGSCGLDGMFTWNVSRSEIFPSLIVCVGCRMYPKLMLSTVPCLPKIAVSSVWICSRLSVQAMLLAKIVSSTPEVYTVLDG